MEADRDAVGPVLTQGSLADAVVAAICKSNPLARVLDRGAYVRVLVPTRCTVKRAAIEREAGACVRLPADLERIMPSFRGALTMTEDEVVWELSGVRRA